VAAANGPVDKRLRDSNPTKREAAEDAVGDTNLLCTMALLLPLSNPRITGDPERIHLLSLWRKRKSRRS